MLRTCTVSVRKLVEFLLRSGDIAPAASAAAQLEAMQAGSDVHRRLQAMAGSSYQAEVTLAHSFYFPSGDFVPEALRLDIAPETVEPTDPRGFFLKVEGRADGVVEQSSGIMVDEIKGTYADVDEITAPLALHDAQARCYAYLYLRSMQGRQGPGADCGSVRGNSSARGLSSASGTSSAPAFVYRNLPIAVRLTYVGLETGEVRRLMAT